MSSDNHNSPIYVHCTLLSFILSFIFKNCISSFLLLLFSFKRYGRQSLRIKLLQTRTTLPCRPGPTSKQQLWKRSIASTTASLAGTTAVHQASHTSLAKGQGSSCLRVIRVTPCSSSLALNVTKSCQCCRISCFKGVQQPPPLDACTKSVSSHCHHCHVHTQEQPPPACIHKVTFTTAMHTETQAYRHVRVRAHTGVDETDAN